MRFMTSMRSPLAPRRGYKRALGAILGAAAAATATGCTGPAGLDLASQPTPPASGPGAAQMTHRRIVETHVPDGAKGYYLFEPADPSPDTAPVIVFVHGYGARRPTGYQAWIRHLVHRGNVVIFPVYQTSFLTPSDVYTPSLVEAVTNAFALLESGDHVRPHAEHLAILGHSVGGVLAANLAAEAVGAGLPSPRALMTCNAGDTRGGIGRRRFPSILDDSDYATIPADILMLQVIGAEDSVVPADAPIFIHESATQIAVENKNVLLLHSDGHGVPPLQASHFAAASSASAGDDPAGGNAAALLPRRQTGRADALDYYGFWKWLDALTDAAFYGINREFALGGTPEQTFLGVWSDGTPVRPAEVIRP
jgi:acetyl esterase/lipase